MKVEEEMFMEEEEPMFEEEEEMIDDQKTPLTERCLPFPSLTFHHNPTNLPTQPTQPLKFPFPLTGSSRLQGILAIDREDGEREEGEYSEKEGEVG